MGNSDQQFVEELVKAIVNNPGDVKATRTVDERGVLITLDVNPADMGYVIGRRGQTAHAIRTLLKIVGAKNNARVNLKINEPVGGRQFPAASASSFSSAPAFSAPAAPVVENADTSSLDNFQI